MLFSFDELIPPPLFKYVCVSAYKLCNIKVILDINGWASSSYPFLLFCLLTTKYYYKFYKTAQVTWVEHAEYDESTVHQLYRPLLSSGMGFGAQRWVATLQRQCECLAILMSSAVPSRDHTGKYPPSDICYSIS